MIRRGHCFEATDVVSDLELLRHSWMQKTPESGLVGLESTVFDSLAVLRPKNSLLDEEACAASGVLETKHT